MYQVLVELFCYGFVCKIPRDFLLPCFRRGGLEIFCGILPTICLQKRVSGRRLFAKFRRIFFRSLAEMYRVLLCYSSQHLIQRCGLLLLTFRYSSYVTATTVPIQKRDLDYYSYFGCLSLSSPSVTLAETIVSPSLISAKKSLPSTTYPKLQECTIKLKYQSEHNPCSNANTRNTSKDLPRITSIQYILACRRQVGIKE